jgi:hypothetical protein
MSSNPVTALLPPPIQEKHSPPIPLTPASTRNTPPADPGIPATASDHARDATDRTPRACRILAVVRNSGLASKWAQIGQFWTLRSLPRLGEGKRTNADRRDQLPECLAHQR